MRKKLILKSGEIEYRGSFPGDVPRRVNQFGCVGLWKWAGNRRGWSAPTYWFIDPELGAIIPGRKE